ncbi:MAG: methionyl-tRNA formyltransferase, partial [Actinomycetota bacterium]|nr:methionyl-tRNA formyltransferase [Actinomycetota bacterium]
LGQPEDVNDEPTRALIAAERPDAVCVCAFGALIREPLLSAHPMLNVHPSLLPRWRGAAPVERAIMAGDRDTGVSIMELTAGLDSGPVSARQREPIAAQDTYGTLAPRLAQIGGELLVEVLDERPAPVPQDEEAVTSAEKITPADRELRPELPAVQLQRTVRALSPHIGTFVSMAPVGRLGVVCARVGEDDLVEAGSLSLEGPLPVLGCSEGALELVTVQPPGGRPMSGEDYLRGRRSRR